MTGPAPSTPRLATLDPATVAREAVDLVAEHVRRLTFYAGWDDGPSQITGGSLGLEVSQLTAYAQTGAVGDWPDASCAIGCLQTVCECLYSQAGVPGTFGGGPLDTDDADPDTAIGVVILAAHARYRLDTGPRSQGVPLAELAALASVSPGRLRQLTASGELRSTDGRVRADDARRWLAARGVAGFASAPPTAHK